MLRDFMFKGYIYFAFSKYSKDSRRLTSLRLSPRNRIFSAVEWHDWERDYLPPGGLSGRTFLDVGAGEGETIEFASQHGGTKFIAIESNPRRVKKLRENARLNGWDVEIVQEGFKLDHLRRFNYDFVKIDVEGAEECLLSLADLPKPLVMEIHGRELMGRFRQKFPKLRMRKLRWFSQLWIAKYP